MESTQKLFNNKGIGFALVLEAKRDWQLAQEYFAWVVESELIDFAIFWERVARLRYLYLLHRLRAQGYHLDVTELMKLVLEQGK